MVSALMLIDMETKQSKIHSEQLIAQYLQKLLTEAEPARLLAEKLRENKNGRSKVVTAAR